MMIKSHVRTAWRTLVFNRTYSVPNLIGLSVGLSVAMLIATFVLDEWSYDQQWNLKDELYRLHATQIGREGQVVNRWINPPAGLGEALNARFPEIVDYTNIHTFEPLVTLRDADGEFFELEVLNADTNFFNLFEIKNLAGDPKLIHAHVPNLVITESAHRRYFGSADVVGELFHKMSLEDQPEPVVITAIIEDLPHNSHLYTEAILVGNHHHDLTPGVQNPRKGQYLRLEKGTDTALLNAKINAWYNAPDQTAQEAAKQQQTTKLGLQPITDIHLHSLTGRENRPPVWNLYILGGIGILMILLVCINFINLAFAHTIKRSADAGIRKVLGAEKRHFVGQLAVETILLFGGGFLLALPTYAVALPLFERHVDRLFTVNFLASPLLLLLLLALWLLVGIICAMGPSHAAIGTNITDGLRKRLHVFNLPLDRRATQWLVGFQFCVALVLTLCMVTSAMQLHFMFQKDLGYQPQNLLVVKAQSFEGKGEVLKRSLLQHPDVTSVSLATWTPFDGAADFSPIDNPNNPDQSGQPDMLAMVGGDFDYAETMGMELLSGRFLRDRYALDAVTYDSVTLGREIYSNVLVNERMIKNFALRLDEESSVMRHRPVGVVRDFHGASLRYPMPYMLIEAKREIDHGILLARVAPGRESQALDAIRSAWKTFFPDQPPRIVWMDEQVKAQYLDEERQFHQLLFFSCLSILIALLSIFGIAIYTVERRTKEIGIRKVLGASAGSIVGMICRSFIPLLSGASLVALPIAWWIMDRWLAGYAYRIAMPSMVFLVTTFGVLLLTLLVVGLRVWGTARTNPVDSLRDE